MDAIFAYSRACREFEAGRNEVMEQMASLNESLDAYGREHPSIEKYSDVLVNSIGVAAMAGIVLAAPEVGLVATMGTAATTAAYGELFNCLIENGSDKFVEYCALLGRTEAESVRYGTAAAGIVGKLLKIAVIRGGLKSVGGKKGGTVRTMNTAEASARAKELFHAKAANENAVIAKVNQGIFDAVNKAPYNSRIMEAMLKARYGDANVTSFTMTDIDGRNVKLSGKNHSVTKIPFTNKGAPIFDSIVVCDLRIPVQVASINNADLHFKEATIQLKKMIHMGVISKNLFSEEALIAIEHEVAHIPGFTWHHHEDFSRLQLVPQWHHSKTGHDGGMKFWPFKSEGDL